MGRPKTDFKAKMQKDFPEFVAVVDGESVGALEALLSKYTKEAQNVQDAQEADEALESARAAAKDLGAPYRDAKSAIKKKLKYIVSCIREKGGN
jgi:hypothetical protein